MKKDIMFLLCVSTMCCLVACNNNLGSSGQTDNKTNNKMNSSIKSLSDELDKSYKLGDPALINLREAVAGRDSCLALNDDEKIRVGATQAKKSYKSMISTSEILKDMGIDGTLKGGYKDYGGNITAKFRDLTKATSKQIQYAYNAKGSINFSLPAVYSVASGSPVLSQCGDSYASEVDYGLYIGTVVTLSFKSSSVKQLIEASGEINASTFASLAGSLKKMDSNYTKDATVTIVTTQLGGDIGEFYREFNKTKGDKPIAEFSCSLEDADKCVKLLEATNDYMHGSFATQIDSYLMKPLKDKSFNSLKDLQGLWGFDILSYQAYKNSANEYNIPYNISEKLVDAGLSYDDSQKFYDSYSQYLSFGSDFSPKTDDIEKSEKLLEKLSRTINTLGDSTAKICYGPLLSDDAVANCENNLDANIADIDKTTAEIKKVFPFRAGVIKTVDQKPNEYLLYLGGDDSGEETYMTYAKNIADAVFIPGQVYKLDANAKTIYSLNNVVSTPLINKLISFGSDNCTLKNNGTFKCDNYNYTDANGQSFSATSMQQMPSTVIMNNLNPFK